MGRYENTLKYVQLRNLLDEKKYDEALEIAEYLETGKIKDVSDLKLIADAFRKCGKYDKAKELYGIVCEQYKTRKNLYGYILLCLKSKDNKEAERCYKEYVNVDKNSIYKYILRYRIDKACGAARQVIIHDLEVIKREYYMEEWAYELARQYHKAGMAKECVRECEDIILWFATGEIVEKARLLKQHYDNMHIAALEEVIVSDDTGVIRVVEEASGDDADSPDIADTMDISYAMELARQLADKESGHSDNVAADTLAEEYTDNAAADTLAEEYPDNAAADTLAEEYTDNAVADTFAEDYAVNTTTDTDVLAEEYLAGAVADVLAEDSVDNAATETFAEDYATGATAETVADILAEDSVDNTATDTFAEDYAAGATAETVADILAEDNVDNADTPAVSIMELGDNKEDSDVLPEISRHGSRFNYVMADSMYESLKSGIKPGANFAIALSSKDNADELAKGIADCIDAEKYIENPRLAKISAQKLNGINICEQVQDLIGTCLIIENAADMSVKTINGLLKIIDGYSSKMVIILVDQEERLSRFLFLQEVLNNQIKYYVIH